MLALILTLTLNFTGTLDLSKIECLILDEADRMLDMGFEEEMDKVDAQAHTVRGICASLYALSWARLYVLWLRLRALSSGDVTYAIM